MINKHIETIRRFLTQYQDTCTLLWLVRACFAYRLGGMVLFAVMTGALITRIIHGTGLDDALSIAYFGIFMLYVVGYDYHGQEKPQSDMPS